MKITFGKHTGKTVEWALLRAPEYVAWALSQSSPGGSLGAFVWEARRLISIFDQKPITRTCSGRKNDAPCGAMATRPTVYLNNLSCQWWCGDCDPYQQGASPGKIQSPRTYEDALRHVKLFCTAEVDGYQWLIKELAEARGFPERATPKALEAFFKI
ncbi:MAG: hypothetical protein RBU45_19690 [Myxococcota bacterium]|jgi:hypothetical protein|nr:hypothetical protein [Myxococcota bacterium]